MHIAMSSKHVYVVITKSFEDNKLINVAVFSVDFTPTLKIIPHKVSVLHAMMRDS